MFTYTRRADTLHKLTINGLGGNDQLYIDYLPPEMTVEFNGGSGDDSAFVGHGLPVVDGDLDRIQGSFTFTGGASVLDLIYRNFEELAGDLNPLI